MPAPEPTSSASPAATGSSRRVRWSEDVEDEFPSTTVIGPDESGLKTVIERFLDEDGKKVQVTRVIRVKKVQETVNHAVAARKHWKKFGEASGLKPGPDTSTTKIDDELVLKLSVKSSIPVQEEAPSASALSALKNKDKMVVCRICKGDHWTLKCPYKDTLGALTDITADEAEASKPEPADEAPKKPTGKYVPPSLRNPQTGMRQTDTGSTRRSEENTIRVSNLSEDTREGDLQDLFRPFGLVTRVFLVKDKITGASKGFAFVSFSSREEGARAIKSVNGYGYDNLILKVEWSKPAGDAPASYAANADAVRVQHLHWDAAVSMDERRIDATAALRCVALVDGATELVLDTSHLAIGGATDAATGATLVTRLDETHPKFGAALHVAFAHPLALGETTTVRIVYNTTAECTALQWLAPVQTVGKLHPYMFSQCQAIHARSLVPVQDTPGVKFTYSASPLTALMSAVRTGATVAADGTRETVTFEQRTAIPSYLLAIAVGHLKGVRVGPRSTVWSEPEVVDAAAWEFADTETFIATGEALVTPYSWGVYDLLLLPGSFPYGGMENPCLTFVTPTLLAGDRSLVDVVAHEIAHSWFGNLVTTSTWEHFWLNEGFTVFLERKIVGRLHGDKMRHFSALIGWNALDSSVQRFGETNALTALVPDLTETDPDDSFSSVPYEKGFNLLFHLEQRLGGPDVFEPYVTAHVTKFMHHSITTADWYAFLREYVQKNHPDKVAVLDTVDWEAWLFAPGMPPVPRPFDTSLADSCVRLAERWQASRAAHDFAWAAGTLAGFTSGQKVYFLECMLALDPMPHELLAAMDAHYQLTAVRNAEVRHRWQMLCLRASYEPIYPHVVQFVTEQGRMKFVRPLYQALHDARNGADLARATFLVHRASYHPIAAGLIEKAILR